MVLVTWVWLMPVVQAVGEKYCSSQNTGSGDGSSWLYQSNGWCSDHCAGSQYAIIQGANCWCSESAPGSVVSLSDCSDPCIGYPAERCGNKDAGLFQYLYLGQGSPPSFVTSVSSSASSTASFSSGSTSSSSETSSVSTMSSLSSSGSSSTSSSSSTSASSSTTTTSSTSTSASSSSTTTTSSTSTSASSSSTTTMSSTSTSSTSSTSSSSTSSTSSSSTSSSSSSSSTSASSSSSSTLIVASSSSSTPATSSSPRPTSPVQTQYSTSVIGFTSVVYSVLTLTQTQTTLDGSSGNFTTQLTHVSQLVTTMTMVVTTSSSSATVVALAPSNVNKSNNSDSNDYWHSPGKVAGTFVAVGVVVLAIILLLLWFFLIRPRKQKRDFEEQYNEAVLSPRRHDQSSGADSVNYGGNRSSSGSQGFVYADEKGIFEPTLRSKRPSFDDDSLDFTTAQPVIMDQRLDPNQVLSEICHSNSKVSLADDIDYSRKVLRVINE
ncbi:hypothetical protein HG536_0A01690 [Torulaspora globosa]|uniref:WSC domain-containing protein n=1 Tax=Torulaspora globosa TaxID=48254 RepID=A0A7G3ZA16_9SACH|nr:uncharacterized protein HG536_0A01690 [Torulaspora globosa]QLL30352.1 hypothetical protein HG536_0A01690 [Torulaspora globosa]